MKKRAGNAVIVILCVLLLCITAKNTETTEKILVSQRTSVSKDTAVREKQIEIDRVTYKYAVTLPKGYDDSNINRRYPVLYVLPKNGVEEKSPSFKQAIYDATDAGSIVDCIIVEPKFPTLNEQPTANAYKAVEAIITAVDQEYHTIAQPNMRAVIGTQIGGYLATVFTYTDGKGNWNKEPELFGMMASIHGDYQSKENEWKSLYGDFYEIAAGGGKSHLDNRTASKFYTYMSAATEDEKAYVNGGANDIIAYYINRGSAYGGTFYKYYGNADAYTLKLSAKNSAYDDGFVQESVKEAMTGIGDKLTQNMVSGKISLTPQAVLAEEKEIEAVYEVDIGELYTAYCNDTENEIEIRISMTDGDTGEKVTEDTIVKLEAKSTEAKEAYTNSSVPIKLPNIVKDIRTDVTLSVKILGKEIPIETQPLIRIAKTGTLPEEQFVDLMGAWKFKAFRDVKLVAGKLPQKDEYDIWEEVYPCLNWWDGEFSKESNMASYNGYAWYVKEFEIPADFPEEKYYVPMGFFDETDICFINGIEIGNTGLNAKSWKHEKDCWDTKRVYTVNSNVLNIGGSNVITVLTHNQSGDGGWYAGHPGIYSKEAYAKLTGWDEIKEGKERFFTQTIPSKYRAKRIGSKEEYVDENFLVYLPKGYYDPENADKRYPTAYLLHQLNSSSNSYAIDGIDGLLDQGIAEGSIKEMIVIIPDSTGDSWWCNGWDTMVTEEILPYVDANYRTIPDARYRFLAGASMGGSGAYYIGLTNPNLFSGIVSFYGAINMGKSPLNIAMAESKEYLAYFTQYLVCGNRDLYKFGVPAIALDKKLRSYGIEHFFELEEGEHNSEFYLPYVIDAFAYQSDAMPEITAEEAINIVSGEITECKLASNKANIKANIKISDAVKAYVEKIPKSKYAKETVAVLNIPVVLTIECGEKLICTQTKMLTAKEAKIETIEWDIENSKISADNKYKIKVAVGVLNQTVEVK
ncbi:MAG: hypothetical protein J6A75_02250 [Lachnospiraceae bacterium]|nr:hypothetical protein [Lachnospiraceae bacterium]